MRRVFLVILMALPLFSAPLTFPDECIRSLARFYPNILADNKRVNGAYSDATTERAAVIDQWTLQTSKIFHKFVLPLLPTTLPAGGMRILDVGPGFGLYDILVSKHFGHKAQITLFDQLDKTTETEFSSKRVDGWHPDVKAMPFYRTDLACAKRIALANGVPDENYRLLNATAPNLAALAGSLDLIYSHTSLGFHYPLRTYAAAAFAALRPGGRLVVTARAGRAVRTTTEDGTAFGGAKQLKVDQHVTEGTRAGFTCTSSRAGYSCQGKCAILTCVKPL